LGNCRRRGKKTEWGERGEGSKNSIGNSENFMVRGKEMGGGRSRDFGKTEGVLSKGKIWE